jgi:epoxyqueuosine reductase
MEDNAKYLEKKIREFVRESPLNRIPGVVNQPIFDEPLIKYADGDDVLFTEYKKIIGTVHLTPREALTLATKEQPQKLPSKLSVISWILPVAEVIRKSNRKENMNPSKFWAYTRWYGEKFNEAIREYVVSILNEKGYRAAAPAIGSYFKQFNNDKGPYSNWSERHVAYAAGHGTFSLSDGFITERGIAHRCGSVVTDMILPPNKRKASTPYANCTFYVNGTCKVCIERCPAGAITEDGHNKILCGEFQRKEFADLRETLKVGNTGCGLCQTNVPCEYKNPVKKDNSKF